MSDDFSYIILQNSSFGYKVRLMFRLTKTVLIALLPIECNAIISLTVYW
jgi:hypothetical protein